MPQRYSSDRAERARQLHAEGKFGGEKYGRMGGRPRRPPASSEVLEAIELNAPMIATAIEDGLGEHQPIQTRLRAAKLALEIESSVAEDGAVKDADETAVQTMSREDLIGSIMDLVRR